MSIGTRNALLTAFLAAAAVAAGTAPGAASGQTSGDPQPAAVIDRTDIAMSGLSNLQDLFSRQIYNDFGLRRPYFLGAGRAVFLVNGRPASNVDLAMFPVSAVERIEVLEENAARHGGHAVGGTINIVLRHGYEGTEIAVAGSRPTQAGGDANHASAVWGGGIGRGRLTVAFDHIRRREVRDSQRDYSRAEWTRGGSFADTRGVSLAGNTLVVVPKDDNPAILHSFGDCDESAYTGVLSHSAGEGCGYAYADVKWQGDTSNTPYVRRGREALSINADHPFGDDADVYLDFRAAQADTAFRYAPPVGTFEFTPSQALEDRLLAENLPGLTTANFPDDLTVHHRFVGHGNRDWRTDYAEYDVTLGARGRFGNGLGYDANVAYYRRKTLEKGATFVSESLVRAAIEAGEYDIENPLSTDPDHLTAIRETSLRLAQNSVTDHRTARAALNGRAFKMSGGDLRWSLGMEVGDEEWKDHYDYRDSENRFHDATDVLGSAGNSSAGKRLRWSALAEMSVPLLSRWDLDLAARRDAYDDVGDAHSWRVASRYPLDENFAIRASWDRGSAPPSLADMHLRETLGYPEVCDPQNDGECAQKEAVTGGNPDLKPDKAERFAIGATANLGPFTLGADWFRFELSDTPAQLDAQALVDLEETGRLPSGARVIREGGLIRRIENPILQAGETDAEGIDLRAGAAWDTGWAHLAMDFRALRTTRYESRVAGVKQPGDYPRDRFHGLLRAKRGGFTASWNVHRVSGYRNVTKTGRYDGWTGHDVAFGWQGAFGIYRLYIAGGVLNVGNRGPAIDSSGDSDPDLSLDSVMGRTIFLKATLSLGP